MSKSKRTIKILHVFGRMGVGGAEAWVLNALRRIDRERFRFEFLVHRTRPGEHDDEVRSLGASIRIAPSYKNPPRYAAELGLSLREVKPDIVHSHVGFFSGWVLTVARAMGIQRRMVHSHNDLPAAGDTRARALYKRAMRAAIHASATHGLGCSAQACASLYGPDWQRRGKYEVLLYGYDFSRFAGVGADTRAACRQELGLGAGDFVIGHIGRMVDQKNHPFIIELAAASKAAGRNEQKFVLVGDGENRPAIEREIAQRGLTDKIVVAGQRTDIHRLLSSFDVFILPSRWEGLGIVALEAQAAGVKCILGDRVPEEATVLERNVIRRSIDDVRGWLEGFDELRARDGLSAREALAAMQASPFGIDQHIARLERIYEREAGN